MTRPFAPACERNAEPILDRLRTHLPAQAHILEIGSGTGQHALHFATAMPAWRWQCSDRNENLPGIAAWLDDLPPERRLEPLALDVFSGPWPPHARYDAIFSANTLHIMPWEASPILMREAAKCLRPGGKLLIYGPFNYNGGYSSPSNAEFDGWLKQHAPHQGIRDFEAVDALAQDAGLRLLEDHGMPANNRLLCWQRENLPV